MSENNDNSSESNSVGSDTFFQPTRANRATSSILRQSVLRPSVLDTAVNSATNNANEVLKGPKEAAKNPFQREFGENEQPAQEAGAVGGSDVKIKDPVETTKEDKATTDDKDEKDDTEIMPERPHPMTMLRKNGLERCNLFASSKSSIPRVETTGFVFGENVHERVVGENVHADGNSKNEVSVNGTSTNNSEMLFSSVIQNAAKSNETNNEAGATGVTAAKDSEPKSLNDVAREYEESRGAQKRKFLEVETFTGEENEVNIIDINCKLFAFVNSNWEERGRGSLRLNSAHDNYECSRVVFRTSGNLRLLLNTKVWAGMVAERPSQKSMRLTAMDATGQIKIYLVMGRPADISRLHTALYDRIQLRKNTHPHENQNDGLEPEDAQAIKGDVDEEGVSVSKKKNGTSLVSSTVDNAPEDSESDASTNEKEADTEVLGKSNKEEEKDVTISISSVSSATKNKISNTDVELNLDEPSPKKRTTEEKN